MTTYELVIVAVNDKADQLLGRVEKSIKEVNGLNVKVDRLGKKQLAYAIKKQTDATYFLLNFEAEAEAIKPVWDKLRLEQEDLLRYLLLKKENKKPRRIKGKRFVPKGEEVKEEKEKPTVTVAVKKSTGGTKGTKSTKGKVSKVRKVSKVKKSTKAAKSTKSKGKK